MELEDVEDARILLGRAVECVPQLVAVLRDSDEAGIVRATEILEAWDGNCLPEEVGPTLFNVFYRAWCRRVAAARFDADEVELLVKGVEPVAGRLLESDPHGWFADDAARRSGIVAAMGETLEMLVGRLGDDIESWNWGRLHLMPLRHVLSGRNVCRIHLQYDLCRIRGRRCPHHQPPMRT